ncbi:MAG: hypothetical protein K6F88_01670 [Ruminococcus sp.]|nr:hypothetical protein [Ruminococcus sp.]
MSKKKTIQSKPSKKEASAPLNKNACIIIAAVELFLFIFGLLDVSETINLTPFKGTVFFLFVASIPIAVMYFLGKKLVNRGVFKFMGIVLIIAALLEITLFQFPTYSSFMSKGEQFSLAPSTASLTGSGYTQNSDGSVTISGEQEAALEFNNVNKVIDTIKTNLEFADGTKCVKLNVDASDETHYTQRINIGTQDITKTESSQFIRMHLNGKVTSIKLKFTNIVTGSKITVKGFDFNRSIPFNIMYLRFLLIALLALLSYALFSSKALKATFENNSTKCFAAMLALFLAALVCMTAVIGYKLPDGGLGADFQSPATNQINQEIVDAFEKGHVELDVQPSEGFKALSNPYDWSLRLAKSENGAWDHVYFNGKYYSYYGVAPVFVLFLPYHLITNHYFPTDIAILLFSIIGLAFLSWLYFEIISRFFKKLPLSVVISGFVVMISSCGVFYLTGRTLFYEISISSGFMFTTLGAFLLVSSNIFEDKKVNVVKILFSSLCFGMAVLARPTLAVYAFCAALFFGWRILKDFKSKAKGRVLFAICAAVPLAACAIFQMWYNYARFGSFLDFGISYSVTINDFTKNSFYLIFVLISLFGYLLATPTVSPTYPFVTNNFNRLGANGYYFQDVGSLPGIIFLAFPVLGYLFGGKALKLIPDKKQRLKYLWMIGLPCLLMPIVIICSVWESGYAVRYVADFTWEMLIGALIILYFLYLNSENEHRKKLFEKLMAFSAVAAVIINGILIFNFTFESGKYPEASAMLSQMISFWI